MSSTPEDKPHRATAAQLANRKIKDVRRRPRPSPNAPGPSSASFGGPFSSIDPNIVSAPSASSQPVTNGFSFGQSQSFPPASSAPQPQAQNGGSQFAFGAGGGGGGPSTFNFSSSFGGQASTPSSNPFASMNTSAPSQQPEGSNFSGFKGNMFSIPPVGSQPAPQQSLPSGGMFGSGSQQSGSTGGLFGSTATSGSSQPSTTAPSNDNMFGQSNTGAPLANIFGQSGSNKPSPFAQSTSGSSDSMQTSPDAKSTSQKMFSFGSGSGASTSFGGSGGGNLFNSTSSAPTQTPSKPLFGAKPAEETAPGSPFTFSATPQPTFSASPAPSSTAAPATTGTSSSSLFSASTSKPLATPQNPFQFGASTPVTAQRTSEETNKGKAQPTEPSTSQSSTNLPSTSTGPSLFSQSQNTAPPQSSGLFQQAPSTGSLFAAKPASSTEQEQPKPASSNPFSSLFVPAAATAESPRTEQKPSASFSPMSNNLFAPKPAPSEETKTNGFSKAAPSAPLFSASTPAKSSPFAPQSHSTSISTPPKPNPAADFSQNSIQANSAKPSPPSVPTQSFEKLQPSKMPSGIEQKTKEEVTMLYRIRSLDESFMREVAKLNPATESLDPLLQFYLRVRETIGAPVEGAGTKRKHSADSTANAQPAKKAKTFGIPQDTASSTVGNSTPNMASSSKITTPSQPFGIDQNTPAGGNKRKAIEDGDGDTSSTPNTAKRASVDSTTANIFATSFSRSKTSESNEPMGAESLNKLNAPSFKPATPESAKPALFSTTPTASPSKPLFSAAPATNATLGSGPTPSQPAPMFKPTVTAPSTSTPPTNPFVLKPSGDKGPCASTAPLSIPKFGSGNTNFFAQFKAQSDKEAEKEKEKRKLEDFDSDEDDEAEWERKDAENQRKKREEIEAQKNTRTKFIPGQGFSFEENDSEKSDASAASSMTSVFDAKAATQAKSGNIFGHLSATPSESGENEIEDNADDTEEASVSGDDTAKEPSPAPTEDFESSKVDFKTNGSLESSTPDSSEEGDFAKALKKSKQAGGAEQDAAEEGSGSRSLFDRVQYNQAGNPKRQGDDDNAVSSTFGTSKLGSSFNSPSSTPNPFASFSQPQTDKPDESGASKSTPTNIFGSSTTNGNPFGNSTPATSGTTTPSIFGAKTGTDNTWKLNTPIKFAAESPTPADSESAEPASDSSKPFSALFGAPPAGSKSGSGNGQQSLGFSFGGPSQQSSSFLTPSVLTSTTPSRASTPGVASDTGAEESADGEAAESLPQAELARGRAGEENEDIVLELRARVLMFESAEWKSKAVGFIRILKDKTTSRSRIIHRSDHSGNVILNAQLMKEIKYTLNGTGIRFLVPKAEGTMEQWTIRVKKEDAARLLAAIEENKS